MSVNLRSTAYRVQFKQVITSQDLGLVVDDLEALNNISGGGITSLNGLIVASQTFAIGTTGTNFGIVSAGSTHTFNLPSASALNRGLLTAADWTTFNGKFTLPAFTLGSVLFSDGSTIAQDNVNFFWDDTNNRLGIGTNTPSNNLHVVGTIKYIDGNQAVNKYLASDASGNASWQLLSSAVSSFGWALNGNINGAEKYIGTNDAFSLPFDINGVEVSRFLYSATASINGNFGINEASPSAKLHVKGFDATSSNYGLKIDNVSSASLFRVRNDGSVSIGSNIDPTVALWITLSGSQSNGLYCNVTTASSQGLNIDCNQASSTAAYLRNTGVGGIALRVVAGFSELDGNVSINTGANSSVSLSIFTPVSNTTALVLNNSNTSGTQYACNINMNSAGTQTQYGLFVNVVSGSVNYAMYLVNGNVNMNNLPTGNAGLASGDLYVDTAANILANGDLILARKA